MRISMRGVLSPSLTITIPGNAGSATRRILSFDCTHSLNPAPVSSCHSKPSWGALDGRSPNGSVSERSARLTNTRLRPWSRSTRVSLLRLAMLMVSVVSPASISFPPEYAHLSYTGDSKPILSASPPLFNSMPVITSVLDFCSIHEPVSCFVLLPEQEHKIKANKNNVRFMPLYVGLYHLQR